jgi:hypothetical protein
MAQPPVLPGTAVPGGSAAPGPLAGWQGLTPWGPYGDACRPLAVSEPWRRRWLYADLFIGAISGDEAIDDSVAQHTSFFGGLRLGCEFSDPWAVEARIGHSSVDLANLQGDPNRRTGDLTLWDVSLVQFLGDDPWLRPYLTVGVGAVNFQFDDATGQPVDETVVGVPVGIGIMHRHDDWLAFRFDLTDNMAFGGGTPLGTQHNFSATGSLELRFGGRRTSYWPWTTRHFYAW